MQRSKILRDILILFRSCDQVYLNTNEYGHPEASAFPGNKSGTLCTVGRDYFSFIGMIDLLIPGLSDQDKAVLIFSLPEKNRTFTSTLKGWEYWVQDNPYDKAM
ncbi:MAG: hypothetical protein PHQ23_02745 [Candidatus Wallbacteria bacterium]|nr:hypothetical protein [Candidatus Wallbacteria bacterium]